MFNRSAVFPPLMVTATLALASPLAPAPVHAQTLEAFARLPADTFAPGPTSGQMITPANGRIPPFEDKQPVQGFSSVLAGPHGDFFVMPDNGFGAKANSADYVLRVYRISPDFKTARHGNDDDRHHGGGGGGDIRGTGKISVESFISLRDPFHKINFPIVADLDIYPGTAIAVDPQIRARRLLTGGDFDIESVRVAHDGTLWFGDEFGPFLLHTDAVGRVLDAPYPLPGVRSPQNPFLGSGTPNLASSKGFEGMAIAPNGRFLYPLLEGPLTTDPNQSRLIINQFDLKQRRYTGKQWFYRLEAPMSTGQSIGDMTQVFRAEDLVPGDVIVVATGVTNGDLLRGVRYLADSARTHSLIMCMRCNWVHFTDGIHFFARERREEVRLLI